MTKSYGGSGGTTSCVETKAVSEGFEETRKRALEFWSPFLVGTDIK